MVSMKVSFECTVCWKCAGTIRIDTWQWIYFRADAVLYSVVSEEVDSGTIDVYTQFALPVHYLT